MDKAEQIKCVKLSMKMSEDEKLELWRNNIKICISCLVKKEPYQDDCYYCSSCEKTYYELEKQ